jgi:hypothetical protein
VISSMTEYNVVVFIHAPPTIELFSDLGAATRSFDMTWSNVETKPTVVWSGMHHADIKMNETVVGEIMIRPVNKTAVHL